jgi:hypothetical protein
MALQQGVQQFARLAAKFLVAHEVFPERVVFELVRHPGV